MLSSLREKGARAKQAIEAKVGRSEETVDVSYNQEHERFKQNFRTFKKFNKDLRKYFTLLRELSQQNAVLTEHVARIYESQEKMWSTAQKFQTTQQDIDQQRVNLENQINDDIFLPLADYMGQFKTLADRCSERDRRRSDMDRYRTEVKRYSEKPPSDPNKLPTAQNRYNLCRKGYEDLNTELLRDMSLLYYDRSKFMDPVFATMVTVQATFFDYASRAYSEVTALVQHIDRTAIHRHAKVISEVTAASRDLYQPQAQGNAQPPPSSGRGGYSAPQGYNTSGGYTQPAGGYSAPSSSGGYAQPSGGYSQPSAGYAPRPMPPQPPQNAQPRRGPVAQALYPFQAQNPNELSFEYGDMINIISQQGEWWQGELKGKQGLIPSNYVQLVQQ